MKCRNCRTIFAADQNQGYPRHCDPPSSLIAYAILFVMAAVAFSALGVFVLRPYMLAIGAAFLSGALMSLTGIPEARRVCEQHDGGVCPSCKHRNRVNW